MSYEKPECIICDKRIKDGEITMLFPIYNKINGINEDVEICKSCYQFLPEDIQVKMSRIIRGMSPSEHVDFFTTIVEAFRGCNRQLKLNLNTCVIYREKKFGVDDKWQVIKPKDIKAVQELIGNSVEVFGIYENGRKNEY